MIRNGTAGSSWNAAKNVMNAKSQSPKKRLVNNGSGDDMDGRL